MRLRLPSPAMIVAVAALVVAMTGSAIAAKRYLITSTSQISPKVLKSLRGRTGARGPSGLPGAVGAQGPAGPAGTAPTHAVTADHATSADHAASADLADGQVTLASSANDLHQHCPAATHYYMGGCVEVTEHAPQGWSVAEARCETLGGHLPSPEDLYGIRTQPWTTVDATTGEWTGHFWTDSDGATSTTYVELIASAGNLYNRKAVVGGQIGYRCIVPPLG